ncbi:MAG: fibronectin type III domain-containing protein, partial [Defluviitaleaceae bacterium]|nr:fibronectin type III domain-containing protein [Defluviitaleaceae bacterium]
MKNTAKKVIYIVMVLLFVLSLGSAISTGAFSGWITGSVATIYDELGNSLADIPNSGLEDDSAETQDHELPTESFGSGYRFERDGDVRWFGNKEEGTYWETHGRFLEQADYIRVEEYNSYRASGLWLDEFIAMREQGLWFCEDVGLWLDIIEHDILLWWELPFSDEPWDGIHGTFEAFSEEVHWTPPTWNTNEEWWFNVFRGLEMSLENTEIFMPSGMTIDELMSFTAPGVRVERIWNMWFSAERNMYFYRSYGMYYDPVSDLWYKQGCDIGIPFDGFSNIDDLLPGTEPWPDDSELEIQRMSDELFGMVTWACPVEEEYYMTHGRLINYNDYLSFWEYHLFRALGRSLWDFLELRESGMTLTELFVLADPHPTFWAERGFPEMDDLEFDGETPLFFEDFPYVEEEWLEDDAILSFDGIGIMPLSSPTLTVSRGTVGQTTANLTGILSNTTGMTVTFRGFWVRQDGHTGHREVPAGSVNPAGVFTGTASNLLAGTLYHVRAVARTVGQSGSWQSPAIPVTTLAPPLTVPGAPINLRTTQGAGSVTLTWSAPGGPISRYEVSVNNGSWTTVQGVTSTSHTVNGLAPNVTHSFRVRAVNSAGAGLPASTTGSTRPVSAPSVSLSHINPVDITSTSVRLTGSIISDGGSPITARGFWIRRAGQSAHTERWISLSGAFSYTFNNLLPNTTYHVRAAARNGVVQGSGLSNEIVFTTRAMVPEAPRSLWTISGVNQVTLNWSAPLNNGGAAIIRYEVSLNNGSWITATGGLSHTFTNLSSGSQTFRVRAVNSVGASVQSSITASPITLSAPTVSLAPIISNNITSTSVALEGEIINTGGAAINARGFWIRAANESTHREYLANSPTSPFSRTILNLQPGTTYHVRAFARNAGVQGSGLSAERVFTARANVPGAPRSLNPSVSGRNVTLTWQAPLNNGGASLIRYEVSHNGGSWTTVQGVLSLNHTFNNLPYGTHTFRVRAVNSTGAGAYASTTATIVAAATVPGVPQNLNAFPGNNVVALTWSAPISNGGATITRYEVSHNNGAWVQVQSMTSHTVNNLLPGTHTFRVRAVNSVGAGTHASTSATIESPNQPPTPPPAQAGINVTVVDGNGRPIQGALVQF